MKRRTAALTGLACLVVVAVGALVATLAGGGDARAAGHWSPPVAAPVPAASAGAAQAYVDPAGRAHVAWVERHDGRWSLHESSRPLGGAWTPPTTAVQPSPFSLAVSGLAANARGDAAVLFTYGGDRHRQVLAASTRPAGGDWSAPRALSRPTTAAVASGGVGIDASGTITVVRRGLGGPGLWTTRKPAAAAWSALKRISPAGQGTDAPRLEVLPNGRATVVALLKRAGRPPVAWYRRADRSGRWGPDTIVTGSEYARLPELATGADGTTVVSWVRQRGFSSAGARLLAAGRSAGGTWSRPHALGTPDDGLAAPSVLGERTGASVVWARWDGAPQGRRASIIARRVTADGALGPSATVASVSLAPVPRVPDAIVIYGPPPINLIAASGPQPAVSWAANTTTSGGSSVVQAALRDADGRWSDAAVLGTKGRFGLPLAVGAPAGRAVVVWGEGPPLAAISEVVVSDR